MQPVPVILLTLSLCIVCLIIFLYRYTIGIDAYFNPLPKCSIDNFLAGARTGDLVFFWSNNAKPLSYYSYVASSLQAWATDTPYTHVGLVYRDICDNHKFCDCHKFCDNHKIYLITADRFPKHDMLTGNENKVGNQLLDAQSYLREYNGRMCWYRLNSDTKIPENVIHCAWQEFASHIDHDYYMKLIAFVNLGLQIWNNKPEDKKTICTTTVFDFLRSIGIITSDNIYAHMNRMNIGIRELEGAIRESGHYSQYPVMEIGE